MRLSWLLQVPRTAELAGQTWQIHSLRLRTLAEIESLALAAWTPPPLPESRDLSDPATRKAWADACAATETPAPAWGTTDCSMLAFGTIPARTLMVRDALREHDLSYEAARQLALTFNVEDWITFDRIAFASDPQLEPYRELDRLLGIPEPPNSGTSWSEAVAETARELGVSPHSLADWTIGEFNALRCGGKRPSPWGDYEDQESAESNGRPFDAEAWEYYTTEVSPRRAKFWAEFPSEPSGDLAPPAPEAEGPSDSSPGQTGPAPAPSPDSGSPDHGPREAEFPAQDPA